MEMKMIKDIEYRACKELEEIFKKKDWGPPDYSALHQLTGSVKNLKKIEESEMESGGYAMNGVPGMNGHTNAGRWIANGSMEGEYGHANRRRNSMGQYTSENGYTNHGENLHSMLEEKLRHARSEREREDIRRCMDAVRNI